MRTGVFILLVISCFTVFGESDKYLVLTDGKEIRCDSLEVTDDGYRAVINGETKEYKFSEATIKIKPTGSSSSHPAPLPAPKKVTNRQPFIPPPSPKEAAEKAQREGKDVSILDGNRVLTYHPNGTMTARTRATS